MTSRLTLIFMGSLCVLCLFLPITDADNDLIFPEFQFIVAIPRVQLNMILLNENNETIENDTPELTKYDIKLNVEENGNIIVAVDLKMKFQRVLKEFIEEGNISLEIEPIRNGSIRIKDNQILLFDIIERDCEIKSVQNLTLSVKGLGDIKTNYEINNTLRAIIIIIESEEDSYSINSDELSLYIVYELKDCVEKFIPVNEESWYHRIPIDFYSKYYAWSLSIEIEFPNNYNVNLQNSGEFSKIDDTNLIYNKAYLTPNDKIEFQLDYITHLSFFEKIRLNLDIQLFWAFMGSIIGFSLGILWEKRKK